MEVSGTNKLILPKDIILADREREKVSQSQRRLFFCGEKGHRFFPVAVRNGDAVRRK